METESAYESFTICGCLGIVCDCEDGFTALAMALDIAMACDEAAQVRYLAIHGRAWECNPAVVFSGRTVAASTVAKTIVR